MKYTKPELIIVTIGMAIVAAAIIVGLAELFS